MEKGVCSKNTTLVFQRWLLTLKNKTAAEKEKKKIPPLCCTLIYTFVERSAGPRNPATRSLSSWLPFPMHFT